MTSVEAFARDLAARDEFAGVIRVDHGADTIIDLVLGPASRAWNAPVTNATRFDTASITKLFTAVATLQCVARGDFTLRTPVVDFLGIENTTISPAVTAYQLLTHTSGIADVCDEDAGESYEHLFAARPNYAIVETRDWLPLFADRPAWSAPGTATHYNNAGYLVLGLMIERASGLSYRDYVTRHVFEPAEMTRAGFFSMDRVEPDVAEGVDPIRGDDGAITGWKRNIYSYPPTGAPDGGAFVAAADLVAFHRALTTGRLLDKERTDAMLAPHEHHRDTLPRFLYGDTRAGTHLTGFGFEFERDTTGAVTSYWKEGMSEGASGVLRHVPDRDTTIVVLAIGEAAAWPVIAAIDTFVESWPG